MNSFNGKAMLTFNALKRLIHTPFILLTLFIFRHLKNYPIRHLTGQEKLLISTNGFRRHA